MARLMLTLGLCYSALLTAFLLSAEDSFLSEDDLARGVEILDSDLPSEPLTSGLENPDIFQGDIDLGQEVLSDGSDPNVLNNAIRDLGRRWADGRVPYVLASYYSSHQRGMIAAAFEDYKRQTCVRFVPRSNEVAYIQIVKGSGCSSTVGTIGRVQRLSLADDCFSHGVIIHELMHAFSQVANTTYRDQYVTIHWNNIRPGMAFNFEKYQQDKIQHLREQYDYGSVMHYFRTVFSRNGQPTITPKQSGVEIGQQRGFSAADVRKINKLYGCATTACKDYQASCSHNKEQLKVKMRRFSISSQPSCYNFVKTCKDQHDSCSTWAEGWNNPSWTPSVLEPQCAANPSFMETCCSLSCNTCSKLEHNSWCLKPDCKDQHAECSLWASGWNNAEWNPSILAPQCSANSQYMHRCCSRSCNTCSKYKSTDWCSEQASAPASPTET